MCNQWFSFSVFGLYFHKEKHFLEFLKDNKITAIKGIEACQRLSHLSLAHNDLEKIQGLNNLPIKILNLVSMNLFLTFLTELK